MITIAKDAFEGLQKENEKLKEDVNLLKEQLAWFTRQLFGKRSEKTFSNELQLQLNLECKIEEAPKQKQTVCYERKKPNRNGKDKINFPSDLPIERQVIDLSEEKKICEETGLKLVKIGEEVTQKLAHKPGSFYIKEIVRFKYALPNNESICTAPLPEGLLNRCQADESLLAEILVKKFADHLPLYRISEILRREGINISRQLLCKWVIRVGQALKPLYDEMTDKVLKSENVFADETPIDMLEPGKGKTHQAYMWVLVGGKEADPPYRIYNFRTNRQHSHAEALLKNYKGVLHSDKYGAYETLANRKQIIWCPCWAHIRRKFLEESGDAEFRNWVIERINNLFALEAIAWTQTPEERLNKRQIEEVPIIDELTLAIKDKLSNGKILPKSKFREALGYYSSLIPYLKNYTQNPWARLDNNVAERAVRPLAIGRKNWLFVGNKEGGEAAAIILSLIQTCRGIGVNPREYLEDIMRTMMKHNSQKLYELLPDNWARIPK